MAATDGEAGAQTQEQQQQQEQQPEQPRWSRFGGPRISRCVSHVYVCMFWASAGAA